MPKFTLLLALVAALSAVPAAAADMSSVATLVRPAPGGSPWSARQVAQLRSKLARLLAAPTLRGAQVGLVAIDTVRGTTLISQNADQEFMPASNFKLLVGSASLQRLGPAFTFSTGVLTDGTSQGGVLTGNVYLRGGGDAHLTASDLDAAATTMAAAGIRSISGSVVTDASHFDAQRLGYGWSWDDLAYYYAPVVTALTLDDNIVHIHMSPGAVVGDPVRLRVEPQSNAFTIDNRMTTGAATSTDTSDIIRPWDEPRTIRLTGTYPLGAKESGDLQPAVPDPESFAGDVFARELAAHGITVTGAMRSGKTPPLATPLWTHPSEALPALLADFWYPSDNLMGELFLKELGVAQKGEPGTDAGGIAFEQSYLRSIGVDPATVTISDGSGLSQYDRITPADFIKILQADWISPNRNVVMDALPVPGFRGTLKTAYLKTPAVGTVFAKTGSISHVRTISGYIKTKTHGPVTFSFLVN
ncbi:MAG: D-alanyl-D-alanine carboxypeptidase/D-alanyl-D-alanine-endopeptidase, partial [Candidatus Eremiobacteraeota bacterium]|nr:D-alanyl-D-alanine carboxypeptidase/D-alanyl-D-alanine-endopeptidase [Candidatus Eremiobacteraeota bacterium]